MEPEGSLPHSQVPATCPYPEPSRSSPHPHILLPEDPSYSSTKPHVHFSLFISYQNISPGPRHMFTFGNKSVFTTRSCWHLAQHPRWRTTLCRLSATAYAIHLQLPFILEAVPQSATWSRPMPRRQEPTYHGVGCQISHKNLIEWA